MTPPQGQLETAGLSDIQAISQRQFGLAMMTSPQPRA